MSVNVLYRPRRHAVYCGDPKPIKHRIAANKIPPKAKRMNEKTETPTCYGVHCHDCKTERPLTCPIAEAARNREKFKTDVPCPSWHEAKDS